MARALPAAGPDRANRRETPLNCAKFRYLAAFSVGSMASRDRQNRFREAMFQDANLSTMAEALSRSEDYRVLRRLVPRIISNKPVIWNEADYTVWETGFESGYCDLGNLRTCDGHHNCIGGKKFRDAESILVKSLSELSDELVCCCDAAGLNEWVHAAYRPCNGSSPAYELPSRSRPSRPR
jgi:hypothetical protein